MNRHFYGSSKGLPLESLAKPAYVRSLSGQLLWLQSPYARIISDELFLRITHTIEGRSATLRASIDNGWYCICMHVSTDPLDLILRQVHSMHKIPELSQPEKERQDSETDSSHFQDCQDVLGCCRECLTDYVITIERAEVYELVSTINARDRVSYRQRNIRVKSADSKHSVISDPSPMVGESRLLPIIS